MDQARAESPCGTLRRAPGAGLVKPASARHLIAAPPRSLAVSILKIARMGHPVLLTEAETIADPSHPEIQRLIADMAETMEDANGLGLAAPQVYAPLRLFVWRAPTGIGVLINPELSPLGE